MIPFNHQSLTLISWMEWKINKKVLKSKHIGSKNHGNGRVDILLNQNKYALYNISNQQKKEKEEECITDFEQYENQGVVLSHKPNQEQIGQLRHQPSLSIQVQHLSVVKRIIMVSISPNKGQLTQETNNSNW